MAKNKMSKQEKKQIKKAQKAQRKEEAAFNKQLEKEAQERENKRIELESKPVVWMYDGSADITIGENKISNTSKIILVIVLILLVASAILVYLNKNFIIDYITKPKIVLTNSNVELELGQDFNYEDYLAEQDYAKRYKITYPDNSEVDTTKVGEYKVEYKLQTLTDTNVTTLKVKVVDKTKPTIVLTKQLLKLTRGKDTKEFDPTKYIKSYSDNYDKKEDLEVIYTKTFDWSKDEVTVDYSVKDKSGNIGNEKLVISVSDPPKEEPKNNNNNNSGGNTNPGGSNNSGGGGNPSGNRNPSGGGSHSSSPYINGVHNITVPVGTNFQSMVNKLISGVQGSGYVSVDYSGVNLTSPGRYKVTFTSDDGVTKTATVTVTD